MASQTISHYRIIEKLGEGGMGVVYKAEDLKLKRTVALKFLSPQALGSEEDKTRFLREAQAAAALDHPNICTVHEIDEVDGQTFIVMAFLEGQTLAEKIKAGPLELDEALEFATQLARGLQAAHLKGTFHRDIKPANLIITESVPSQKLLKITDFGLAQLAERSRLTRPEITLGTLAYMSPEQTEAAGTDQRTDLWALGCVTYEMVSGQLPFRGDYNQAVQYSILQEEPEPLTGLRTGVPMELEWIVGKCLAKKRDDRYPEAAALILDLSTLRKKLEAGQSSVIETSRPPLASEMGAAAAPAQSGPIESSARQGLPLAKYHVIEDLESGDDSVVYRAEDTQLNRSVTINVVPESAAREAKRRRRMKDRALVAAVVLLIASLAAVAGLWLRSRDPAEPLLLRRFAYTPPDQLPLDRFWAPVAISPNGRHIAVVGGEGAESKLWIRDLDQQQARSIEGTEGAVSLFWSPGSDFVGFAADGELKKVSLLGGVSLRLCDLPNGNFVGGSWSPDGEVIVFSTAVPAALYEVSARGGPPDLLISAETSEPSPEKLTGGIVSPHFLPAEAGRRVLAFTFGTQTDQTMVIEDLESGQRKSLGPGHQPFYSAGHLVYQLSPATEDLWALPFSLETLTAAG